MKTNIFNKQKKFEQEVLSGEYAVGDMEYSSYYKDSFKRLLAIYYVGDIYTEHVPDFDGMQYMEVNNATV